jgi:hypothetical protein
MQGIAASKLHWECPPAVQPLTHEPMGTVKLYSLAICINEQEQQASNQQQQLVKCSCCTNTTSHKQARYVTAQHWQQQLCWHTALMTQSPDWTTGRTAITYAHNTGKAGIHTHYAKACNTRMSRPWPQLLLVEWPVRPPPETAQHMCIASLGRCRRRTAKLCTCRQPCCTTAVSAQPATTI